MKHHMTLKEEKKGGKDSHMHKKMHEEKKHEKKHEEKKHHKGK